MALSRGASDPDPDDIGPLKPCLLRRKHNRDQHCVVASCLEELRCKACKVLAIDESLTPVTLVMAEDGTIVDDDNYFLCLPSNTKFVALACNEKWTYNNLDGGTAWGSQESLDADEADSGAGVKWKDLAKMLKEDLSIILLLSVEELELVSKADPRALAVALSGAIKKAETVQRACSKELALRLQRVQSLHSLRNASGRRIHCLRNSRAPKRTRQDPK